MGATIRAAVQRINLRAAVLCVIGLIAPVLLMSTFASSAGGAVLFGYPPELGWTLPVSLDLVAVVGTVVASMAVSRGLLAYALALVYIPLAVSWAANGLDHAFRDAFLDHASGWWIWTSVGLAGAPPVALIAVLHMAIKLNKERRLVPAGDPAGTELAAIETEFGIEAGWPTGTCTVYRFFDQLDELIYIGITQMAVRTRLLEHRRRQPWWHEVVRIEVEHYGTRAEAHAVEDEVIQRQHPRYNKVSGIYVKAPEGGWPGPLDPELVPTWCQPGADLVPTLVPGVDAGGSPGEEGQESGDDLVPTEERAIVRARELITAGAGRVRVMKETGLKDHVAKALIREHRPTVSARADR